MAITNDEPLNLRTMLGALVRYWWIVALSVAFSCGIAVLAIVFTKPVYRAEALVKTPKVAGGAAGIGSLLGQMSGGLGGLGALAGLAMNTEDDITNEALAVVRSRQFLNEFIASNNLMPELFAEAWDPATKNWKQDLERPPTQWDAYDKFIGMVFDAFKDRKTGYVKIRVDWTNREHAALWVNTIVETLNAQMRQKAISEAGATLSYLDAEHRNTESVAVRAAIFTMMESQMKMKTIASVRKQYAFEFIDPAMVPDAHSRLRPRPLLYLAVAFFVGGLLGFAAVLVRDGVRK